MKTFKVKLTKQEEYIRVYAQTAKEAVAVANSWLRASGKPATASKAVEVRA